MRAIHKNPKQKIPLSIDLLIRNLKMKSKEQEEEIRRLREALNSGDPLHLYISHLQPFITTRGVTSLVLYQLVSL